MTLPLVVCGLNHKTAPLEMRQRFVITPENLPHSLNAVTQKTGVASALILSTCNRTEVYAEIDAEKTNEMIENILSWWSLYHDVPLESLKSYIYIYKKHQTVQHLFRVASGLDSMVLGEPQILGQLKEAANAAKASGTLTGNLTKLIKQAFYAAKKIRTDTKIGENSLSLGKVALNFAKNIFSDIQQCNVMFIGAGEVIALCAKYFQSQGMSHFMLANRTFSSAEKIGISLDKIISLQEIADNLSKADIIVSAVHHLTPLIGKGMVETALKLRKRKPILMIDLAVPRNMEKEIKNLEDVYYYDIDDLKAILEENNKKRSNIVDTAEKMVCHYTENFCNELEILKINEFIQNYRHKMNEIKNTVLKNSLKEYSRGENPEEVMEKMAFQLMNKLLHDPCVWLKELALKQHWPWLESMGKNYKNESLS